MMEIGAIEQVLIECAREGTDISYSNLFERIGLRFSRPKVRMLCVLLGQIDDSAAMRGEPSLAVLVVRATDRLPGHGWWSCRTHYRGKWTGDEARAYVKRLQRKTIRFWQKQSPKGT